MQEPELTITEEETHKLIERVSISDRTCLIKFRQINNDKKVGRSYLGINTCITLDLGNIPMHEVVKLVYKLATKGSKNLIDNAINIGNSAREEETE